MTTPEAFYWAGAVFFFTAEPVTRRVRAAIAMRRVKHAPPPTPEQRFEAECLRSAVDVVAELTKACKEGVAEWRRRNGDHLVDVKIIRTTPELEGTILSFTVEVAPRDGEAIQ